MSSQALLSSSESRNIQIRSWMPCFLPCLALFLCLSTPLFFLSYSGGHGKLARQMTLLMAFCDYLGNCLKDVASAPRPSCPPVWRITAIKDEEENAMEYGLPSSHTLITVCLSGVGFWFVLGCDLAKIFVYARL